MELSTSAFELPLSEPLETARGTIAERRGLLVRVRDEAGEDGATAAVGVGEATPLPGWTESYDACGAALEAAASALSERGPDAALDGLADAPAARHGLELALVDLRARRAGQPLYEQLRSDLAARRTKDERDARSIGLDPVEAVPINVTIGDGPSDEVAKSAAAATAAGVPCCKLKVGARSVDADEERVRAVREAIGRDVALRLDANGAWDPETANDALDRFADHGVEYVEQPLPAEHLEEHAALREHDTGIALDESLAAFDVADVLAADAADVVVCKPTVVGGPLRTLALAERARAAGLDVVVSTAITGVVARTAAVHVAAALAPIEPCGLATAPLLAEDLAPDPAPVDGGSVHVPQNPGTGVSLAALDGRGD